MWQPFAHPRSAHIHSQPLAIIIICINDYFDHITTFEAQRAVEYGIKHYCTIGVNPREANDIDLANEVLTKMEEWFERPSVVAVGELGFDLITDEEDAEDSVGDPVSWYESVVEAKGGDAERVVVLSLVGHPKPNDCIATQWTGMMGAEIATRILQFTSIFPYGYVGDICSADYEPFFAEATDHIDTVCSLPAG